MYKYINRKIGQSDITKFQLDTHLYMLLEFTPISIDDEGLAKFRTKALICVKDGRPYYHPKQKREDFGEVTVIVRDNTEFDDLVSYIAKATLSKARTLSNESYLSTWAKENPFAKPALAYL